MARVMWAFNLKATQYAHNIMSGNSPRNLDKDKVFHLLDKRVMLFINFLLSSNCTLDKDTFFSSLVKFVICVDHLGYHVDFIAIDKPCETCLIFWILLETQGKDKLFWKCEIRV